MYFKRIEMHGFKSFADPVVVEFDKGITCVVGPNGSGKSNISDAIRWVLGEQSAKMLRGGKMEDVIFAGTSTRKSRGMAEVTLVIDNSAGILPIDYNEVAVTRRMFRSGESEYAINNNSCRMRDVREMFMDTGIGVDGYSLIGQGKISDIISNKTDSIREIFEETAGVVMYRTRKGEAERKLNSTSINMDRVNDIVNEIEGRIGGLKEDSIKATEYLGLRERFKELEINITLKNIDNINEKSKAMQIDIEELTKAINQRREEKQRLDRQIGEVQRKNENLEEISKETREKLLKVIGEINVLINESDINTERLSSIGNNNTRLIEEIRELEEKLEREKRNAKEYVGGKSVIDEKLNNLREELNERVEAYTKIADKLNVQLGEIDNKKSQIFNLHNDIGSKKAEISSLSSLKETLERRKIQVLEEKTKGESGNAVTAVSLEDVQKKKESVDVQMQSASVNTETLRQQYNQAIGEDKILSKRIEELKINIGQLGSRKKTIEEMENNYEGYNGAVRFVMKARNSGLRGVVAELINVPSGYEQALETALGGNLQNIICQKDSDAKEAIKELKLNKAGRLTFLPMESIRARGNGKDEGLLSMEGVKGYAVDCISFDPDYQVVMEYLLGRVIIVDTMENAIKLSKTGGSGLRYVTLEGEIINIGGSITGGKYRNKTANILERRAEITTLETKLQGLIKEQNSKVEESEKNKSKIEVLTKDIEASSQKFRDLERESFDKENQIKIVRTALNDFENSKERWDRELENIKVEQENSGKDIVKLEEETLEITNAIRVLEEEIEGALGENQDERLLMESLNEEITKARINASSCETEKNNLDAIVDIINETIEGFSRDKVQKEQMLARLKEERETLLSGHSDSETTVLTKEKEKEEFETSLEHLAKEKTETMNVLNMSIEQKDKIDEETERVQNQKYELEIKDAKQETQLENFKSKLWEEFEISYIQAIEFRKEEFIMSTAIKENREVKNRIRELGEVNVGAIKEYESVNERYEFLTEQRADIEKSMNELNQIIEDMDKIIRSKFKESFDQVVSNFETVFQEFFGGGHATITLDNEENPLDATIEINAQPPGKQLKHINLLSGGEKTMTAIALMFAVLKTKPTPCCILDEVEAALDDANIDIFAKYLRKFEDIQFTLITHQKVTMEYADVMYGVTMPERGISKIYSLKLGDEIQ